MRRKIVMLIILITAVCLLSCSCASKASLFEKVEMPGLENGHGFIRSLCYANKNELIFSEGSRKNVPEGPYINTSSIIIYDLNEKKVINKFKVEKENYVYNIIPYKDGILYSSYELKDHQGTYEWKILYSDKKKKILLDKGTCAAYNRIPQPILIDGIPIYLFENIIAEYGTIKKYSCGIKKISDMQAKMISETNNFRLLETTLFHNGTEYCFLAVKHQKPYCYIGNLDGIQQGFYINGRIGSFAINKDYVAVSIETSKAGAEKSAYGLLTFHLDSSQTKEYSTKEFLYRLKGGPGKRCLCVDWTFTPFEVNLENGEVKELVMPDNFSIEPAISFYPLNETTYLAQFLLEGDSIAYYTVQAK